MLSTTGLPSGASSRTTQLRALEAAAASSRQQIDQLWQMFGAEHAVRTDLERLVATLQSKLASAEAELCVLRERQINLDAE